MSRLSMLRQKLNAVFRLDSEFEAFCMDNFKGVHILFSNSMNRTDKVNLLLKKIDPDDIKIAMDNYKPDGTRKTPTKISSPKRTMTTGQEKSYHARFEATISNAMQVDISNIIIQAVQACNQKYARHIMEDFRPRENLRFSKYLLVRLSDATLKLTSNPPLEHEITGTACPEVIVPVSKLSHTTVSNHRYIYRPLGGSSERRYRITVSGTGVLACKLEIFDLSIDPIGQIEILLNLLSST